MTAHRWRSLQYMALLTAAMGSLALSGCAVWRLGQSAELVKRSQPMTQSPASPTRRLLIVGDSTGVGTGASTTAQSLAGLIAQRHPNWLIDNRSRDGAKLADLPGQLGGEQVFDIVLIQAGANDVIRLTDLSAMMQTIDLVGAAAKQRATSVVWMPAGNVGNAPFFFAPVSWWMTHRARDMHQRIAQTARRDDAIYVSLFKDRGTDPFVLRPELNASDGLHPSDAGYRVWWDELRKQGRVF
jgi:lysophospholipase L1-like esterase